MKQTKSYGLVTGAEHYMLIQAEHHFEKLHKQFKRGNKHHESSNDERRKRKTLRKQSKK